MTTPLTIFLRDIPTINENAPLDVLVDSNTIFQATEPLGSGEIIQVGVEVPLPKIANAHKVYLSVQQPAFKIDEIVQVNLTDDGTNFLVKRSAAADGALEILQRQDENFDAKDSKIVLTAYPHGHAAVKAHEVGSAFDAKKKGLTQAAPVTAATAAKGTAASSVTNGNLHLYLANIPASNKNPFRFMINGKLMHHLTESMPLNKDEHVLLKLDQSFATEQVIKAKIVIKELDIEQEQQFNLSKDGNYLQIAVVENGEAVRVLQRKDNHFPAIPLQKAPANAPAPAASKPSPTASSTPAQAAPGASTEGIKIYLRGIIATWGKPAIVKLNGVQAHKLQDKIAEDSTVVVQGSLPPTLQTVKITLNIPYMGFDVEEEFDLKENGRHVLFSATKKGDGDYDLQIAQQHDPFL